MATAFTLTADWDAEAGVFTTESDLPGLVVEAHTFEELVDLVRALAPEVIAANVPNAQTSPLPALNTPSSRRRSGTRRR